MSKATAGNFIYARVIEAELDKRGMLADLHAAAERLAKKPWAEMQKNLGFYSKALYQAACEVAPDVFSAPEDVAQALKNAEQGELYNVQFLVETILEDLKAREKTPKSPAGSSSFSTSRASGSRTTRADSPSSRPWSKKPPRARARSGSSSPLTRTWGRSTRTPVP